jgi:hypothetical protein
MRPALTAEMASVVVEDRVEAAERYRRRLAGSYGYS